MFVDVSLLNDYATRIYWRFYHYDPGHIPIFIVQYLLSVKVIAGKKTLKFQVFLGLHYSFSANMTLSSYFSPRLLQAQLTFFEAYK